MQVLITFSLLVFIVCVQGLNPTTQIPGYTCNANNDTVQFTLSTPSHSAWDQFSLCSISQCRSSASNNNSCWFSSSTPCFQYRTLTNHTYCAPGIQCSILDPCNNTTYACAVNTSVCVVNSCCSTRAVCLPVALTNFCKLGRMREVTSGKKRT